MNSNTKMWLFLVISPLVGIGMAGLLVFYYLSIWSYGGPDVTFSIAPGEPFSKVNYRLSKRKLIGNAKIFYRYAKINGKLTQLKAGNYEIKAKSTMVDILKLLTSGKSITIKVTIPEGRNLYEIGKILEAKEIATYSNFIKVAKDKMLARKLNIPGPTLEGYLYPETYQFPKKLGAMGAIKAMVNAFNEKTQGLNFQSGPLNKHEVITLASIVEKETGAYFERPTIAGVFHNRLKKRMRLQSDPTTIYGIYESFKGNLKKKHLLQKTPYNTYKISGLPLGPISNPGLASIKAVLNPESHRYLYFVSQNDGTHIFSHTYAQHLKAVNKWQKTYRNRAGKSWRQLKKKNKEQ